MANLGQVSIQGARAVGKATGSVGKAASAITDKGKGFLSNFFSGFFDPLSKTTLKLNPGARFKNQSLADLSTKSKAKVFGTIGSIAAGKYFYDNRGEASADTSTQEALQNLLNSPEATNDPNISSLIQRALSLNNSGNLNEKDEETFSPPSYNELAEGGFGALLDGFSKANPDGTGINGGTHFAQFLQQAVAQGDANAKENYENARKVFEDTLALRQVVSQEENVALQSQISQGNLLLGAAGIEAGRERDQASRKGDDDRALVGRLIGILPDELIAQFQQLHAVDPDLGISFILQAARELANNPSDPNNQIDGTASAETPSPNTENPTLLSNLRDTASKINLGYDTYNEIEDNVVSAAKTLFDLSASQVKKLRNLSTNEFQQLQGQAQDDPEALFNFLIENRIVPTPTPTPDSILRSRSAIGEDKLIDLFSTSTKLKKPRQPTKEDFLANEFLSSTPKQDRRKSILQKLIQDRDFLANEFLGSTPKQGRDF